ncbi:MAG: hypothetical protein ACRDU4_03780 [Mycobacterium sp.]
MPSDMRRATEAHQTHAAHRAVDDPAQLARAARIVRAALARKGLSLADLTPLPAWPHDAAEHDERRATT